MAAGGTTTEGAVHRLRRKYMSFRAVIFAAFFLCGTLSAILLGSIVKSIYFSRILRAESIELQSETQILAGRLYATDYINGANSSAMETELSAEALAYNCRIMVIDRSFRIISDTFDIDTGKIIISESVISCFEGTSIADLNEEDQYLRIGQPVIDQETGSVIGCIFVRASMDQAYAVYEQLGRSFFMICVGAVIVMIPISLLLSAYFSGPFRKLHDQIEVALQGDIETAYVMNDFRETHDLAARFNDVIARLKALNADRAQFVSNVSHELKTPIAAIRVLTSSLLEQGDDVPVEVYRDFVSDIADEAGRESEIIEDLLSIVRLENSGEKLKAEQTDMNAFLEDLLKRLNPLAVHVGVDLLMESYRQVTAEIDRVKLSQALSNIIENAIKYNAEGGYVSVTLNADHRFMYISVADNGFGIPDEAKDHIFERFYRAEQSRSRQSGGTGLGLSITQSIVFLHHGDIKFESTEGEGTTFTVRIPLIYIP